MRILIAVLSIASLLQQAAVPQQATDVEVPLQKLVATVTNSQGQLITGLRASDFIIQENGVPKEIGRFMPDSEAPVSIGVLIDISASMAGMGRGAVRGGPQTSSSTSRWAAVLGATRGLLHLTRPQDEFQLMSFANTMTVIQGFTHDHNKIQSHLREMSPNGFGTNISGAVDGALKEMKKSANRRRGLVVITDVEDNEGGGIAALQRSMHTEEVPVYIFALRPAGQAGGGVEGKAVSDTLKGVSRDGEGRSLIIDVNRLQDEQTAVKIVEFVSVFTTELRGQYTITYQSSVPNESANLRAIRIRTVNPELTVRYRRE